MPYSAEISRANPTCFLFLIDRSGSMAAAFSGGARRKAEVVSDAINRLVQSLVLRCAKSEGVRDFFHVGVIGYGARVGSALAGPLGGRALVPISEVANNPRSIETRIRKVDDGAGGLLEQKLHLPVWLEPVADGEMTPAYQALDLAGETVADFIRRFPRSFPPIVLNVTGGDATGGDPEPVAADVRGLATADGNVLLFNTYLSSTPSPSLLFPAEEAGLPDAFARRLFRMSSPLPRKALDAAAELGIPVSPSSRGFASNADLLSVVQFFDLGTRVLHDPDAARKTDATPRAASTWRKPPGSGGAEAKPWPTSSDYFDAIPNPKRCFSDPELRDGVVAADSMGLPAAHTGNFADVYQVSCPTGRAYAVKCFTRKVPDLHRRYQAISDHLRQAKQEGKLRSLLAFEYLEQGILAAGRWVPVVKMRWMEGQFLDQFVAGRLDRPKSLTALGELWLRLACDLSEAGVAHGDLQHGNVLLAPGKTVNSISMKLIDYDGLWVPELASSRANELGHPHYQHPRRKDAPYHPQVDRFSHLVIYTAIRCLALTGRPLWDRYNNDDNLLFRDADFVDPKASPLFAELWRSDEPEIQALVGRLALACLEPPSQTPTLDEVIQSAAVGLDPARRRRAEDALGVRAAARKADVRPPQSTLIQGGAEDDGVLSRPFPAYLGDEPFVFVSYAHKDREAVFAELARLRQMGCRIWYDEGIRPGGEWPEEIEAALERCSHFLVFLTDHAVSSRNVRNEINLAIEMRKAFVAVHLEETRLTGGLRLQIGSRQAIFRHNLSQEQYHRKLDQALPRPLFGEA
jgi:hypothetical protein